MSPSEQSSENFRLKTDRKLPMGPEMQQFANEAKKLDQVFKEEGSTVYLVAQEFWTQLMAYADYTDGDTKSLGTLSRTQTFDFQTNELKKDLVEGHDYKLVSVDTYQHL